MLPRFLSVGAFCFALNLLVLWFCTRVLGWHYLLGVVVSLILVNGLGFWLNRAWTFRVAGEEATPFWRSLGRYYVVSAGAFALNLALMALFVEGAHFPPLAASALVGVLLTAGNFALHRGWTFGGALRKSR